jgi:hypothetical protein
VNVFCSPNTQENERVEDLFLKCGLTFRRKEENLNIFTMTSFLRAIAVITKNDQKTINLTITKAYEN